MMRVWAKKNYWQTRGPFVVAIVIEAPRVPQRPPIERAWRNLKPLIDRLLRRRTESSPYCWPTDSTTVASKAKE